MAIWELGQFPWLDEEFRLMKPRARVIIDNDFAGDPDDLYQVAHHLLSPSVEVRAMIASHMAPYDGLDPGPESARRSAHRLGELLRLMGLDPADRVYQGSELPLAGHGTPRDSPAARAIVEEAMRDDAETPLYVACGGGLTDLASAYLMEPRIADRLTLVWIGGSEYPGLALAPPGGRDPEYNLNIDVTAGQVMFNRSPVPIWQVPRDMYRQCLVSDAELRQRVRPKGELGAFLYEALRDVSRRFGGGLAETYALGDQPLVLLTALQSFFQPDTASSDYVVVPAPRLDDGGRAVPQDSGRAIRVYTRIDTRLMFEDMFLKLDEFTGWLAGRS